MANYQDLLFNCNPSSRLDDFPDDLLLSSLTNESQGMFKSAESMRSRKRQQLTNRPQQSTILEEDSSVQNIMGYKEEQQLATLKKANQAQQDQRELSLLQMNQELKQQLAKQQQEMYSKELEYQTKLLQTQKQHESMMSLQRTKYEMIVNDLQQKMDNKNQEIIHISLLFKQLQGECTGTSRDNQTAKKMTHTDTQNSEGEQPDTYGGFTSRVYNSYQNHSKQSQRPPSHKGDDKLLSLYRQEIDKIKQQTQQFEMKFENEKAQIRQEIGFLKNQKLQLQNLMCQKSNNQSSDKFSVAGSEHKTNRSKRESQSIKACSHKSKKSFDF